MQGHKGVVVARIRTAVLIDDEELDLKQYQRVIRKSGAVDEVLCFTYADEALEFLLATDREDIDLILLDINIPRMNGFEFLDRFEVEKPANLTSVVILMLTTSLNPDDRARADGYATVRKFLNKPLTVEAVIDAAKIVAEVS